LSHACSLSDARDREGHAGPKHRGETWTQRKLSGMTRPDAGTRRVLPPDSPRVVAPAFRPAVIGSVRARRCRGLPSGVTRQPARGRVGCYALSPTKRPMPSPGGVNSAAGHSIRLS
jgi:hypothetical protein